EDFDLALVDFFLAFSLATAPPMMAPTISPATTSPLSARAGCGIGESGEMDRATMAAPLARYLIFIASLRKIRGRGLETAAMLAWMRRTGRPEIPMRGGRRRHPACPKD